MCLSFITLQNNEEYVSGDLLATSRPMIREINIIYFPEFFHESRKNTLNARNRVFLFWLTTPGDKLINGRAASVQSLFPRVFARLSQQDVQNVKSTEV